MSGNVKTAISYEDRCGNVKTKHCGTSDSVRECVSWLKRQGLKLLSKKHISSEGVLRTGTRKNKAR